MKSFFKAGVVAAALVGAVSAQAAIIQPSTGNSDILAVLTDAGTGGTGSVFVFDTGIQLDSFDYQAPLNFNLTTNSLFNQWFATTTGQIRYTVLGVDSLGNGTSTAGTRRALFTTTANTTPLTGVNNNLWQSVTANIGTTSFQAWNGATNSATNFTTHNTQTNGASYHTATSGSVSYAVFAANWLSALGLSAVNIGNNAEFFYAQNTTTSAGKVTVTDFYSSTETPTNLGGFWNLSTAGQLTYTAAPVPEASEWAMMLAGLGLIGFMVRRRSFNV
jgi:hypothetical protein